MRVLTRDEALALVAERHDVIAACADANPFAAPEWIAHYLREVVPAGTPLLLAEAPDRSFMLMERAHRGEAVAVANYYTSLYSPIAASTTPADSVAGLLDDAARARPRISVLRLAPLSAEAAETAALETALRSRGWSVRRYFCFGNWYLPCDGLSMDDYARQLPSQTRNTLQRKGRKFRDAGGRLAICTTPEEVGVAMRAYDQIYARSWKKPEPYPGFVPGWAAICAARGWLRLGVAWMGEIPVAAQFWFTRNRRAFIFKLAYDEEHASWSAGTLLTGELMRHSFEQDRVVEVDYLTGDDAYKRSWMRERRERVGLLACNPRTLHGLALAGAERARDVLRPLLRRKAGAAGAHGAASPSPEATSAPPGSAPPSAASPSGS